MNLRRDIFQAIADPTRRTILQLVISQPLSAGAIAANFDTARPTVSKHLQILTECKLLEKEKNIATLEKEINSLQKKVRTEKQFNKQVAFNKELRSKLKEKENLMNYKQ